jgi:hypothetical protein
MQTNANAPRPAADFTLPAAGDISLYISLYNIVYLLLYKCVCARQKTYGSFASGTSGGGAGGQHQLYE